MPKVIVVGYGWDLTWKKESKNDIINRKKSWRTKAAAMADWSISSVHCSLCPFLSLVSTFFPTFISSSLFIFISVCLSLSLSCMLHIRVHPFHTVACKGWIIRSGMVLLSTEKEEREEGG